MYFILFTGHVEELFIELTCLIYYVVGLSIMSGVIVSISGIIEEKTKKLDIGDPMDAIRNLRIENLNSKAMKKLGYKVCIDDIFFQISTFYRNCFIQNRTLTVKLGIIKHFRQFQTLTTLQYNMFSCVQSTPYNYPGC